LKQGGSDIVWTPALGTYIVEISVAGGEDADTANNVEQISVTVVDWFDVSVNLDWLVDDGQGNTVPVKTTSGSGDKAFRLTVLANGSSTFDARNVEVLLKITGDVTSAVGGVDNLDLWANSGLTTITPGVETTGVRTWENGSDATDFTEDTRTILAYQTAWEFDGTLSPDGSGSDAEFAIEAELISYDKYGQLPDCVRTWNATGDGENITTFSDFCEVTSTSDDYPSTDYAEIAGSFNPFHDIRISRMGVYQGYNTDGSGVATNFVESTSAADLNVGFSRLYAEVQHRGSDL